MKPVDFEYFAPEELPEALALLEQYGDDAKVLAGGQSLMPLMNLRLVRPRVVIDINRVSGLAQITPGHYGGLTIGALTRQWAVEHSGLVQETAPLLAAVMPSIGHFQIRNRGTVGGSIVHGDPAAELPALSLALDAELVLNHVRGERVVQAEDFLIGQLTTAIQSDELLTQIRVPAWGSNWRWGFQEVCRRQGDFALVGAVALLRRDGNGACQEARIIMFGVGGRAVRMPGAEESLKGKPLDDERLAEAGRIVSEELEPQSDIHASAKYRKTVGGVMARRALAMALGRGKGEGET